MSNEFNVMHQEMIEKQKNRIYKETSSHYSKLQNEIFLFIEGNLSLKQTEIKIKEIIDQVFNDIQNDLESEVIDLAYYEAQVQHAVLQNTVAYGLKGELKKVGKSLIESTIFKRPIDGLLMKESFNKMSSDLQAQTIRQVRIGVLNGLPVREIKNSVTATLNTSSKRYQSFVRTAVQNTTQQAKDLSYSKNKEFIKSIQIVAIMDKRTTDICKGYNLKIYPVGEGPRPPFHYNCRTFTIPIFKDEDLISENNIYSDFNPTSGGYELSSNEKGEFKTTTQLISIPEQKKIEEKELGRKIT